MAYPGVQYAKDKEKEYITLSRSMDNQRRYLNGRAILEVMVEEGDFLERMSRISGSESGQGLLMNLYDAEGNAIYLNYLLPFGTPDEVTAEVKKLAETAGPEVFILSTCNILTDAVKVENAKAMYFFDKE